MESDRGALALHHGGNQYAFSTAAWREKNRRADFPALSGLWNSWQNGQKVSLEITAPVLVPKAEGLEATPGQGNVALTWRYDLEQRGPGTRWEYRSRATGSGSAWGNWSDVSSFATYEWANDGWGFHTVGRLDDGTEYEFQVRAVDEYGNAGPPSESVKATPRGWGAPKAQTVPADWALRPVGVGPGDSFRLLFITTDERHAMSSDIAHYHHFVARAAARNPALVNSDGTHFGDEFRALISTRTTDARDTTATTGGGVPIYYLGGNQVADDYADFYDGSWDTPNYGRDEYGRWKRNGLVWTGSKADGTKGGYGTYAGKLGWPGVYVTWASVPLGTGTLNEGSTNIESTRHLYALSPVLTVADGN